MEYSNIKVTKIENYTPPNLTSQNIKYSRNFLIHMDFPYIFKSLKINTYYKYLLYFCGIIFILSLIIEFKGIDNSFVRNKAFFVIIGSLCVWILHAIVISISTFTYELYIQKGADMSKYYKLNGLVGIFFTIIQVIIWVIIYYLAFII